MPANSWEFFLCLLLVLGTSIGLALPLATRFFAEPTERVLGSVVLSLLGTFLFSWGVYVFALPMAVLWTLPALAALGLIASRNSLSEMLRDAGTRSVLIAQLLVTAWCVGWLCFAINYSGGGWTGDWFEHWQRARFFLERWPRDFAFLTVYPLTARPPLANVVTATFLSLSRADFAGYQVITTALSSLVFLPAALMVRRFAAGSRAIPLLAVLFMLNPLFVQNATFAWTKLPTAFFVLAALYFFLRFQDPDTRTAFALLFALALAGGMVAHYSTGPYLVLLAGAWIALGWRRGFEAGWWRTTALAALAGAAVLATWFGWAFNAYGVKGTLLANTTVAEQAPTAGAQLAKIALNLRDTLVPHFLRPLDTALIEQRSPWGAWRDRFFQGYQLNVFLACGSVAWLAILRSLARDWRVATPWGRRFWFTFVTGTVALGVAAHGARDHWGLAHICLQPLVLLGLAYLAARWRTLGRRWQLALLAGAVVDFILGIVLHFAVQSYTLDRWLTPDRPPSAWVGSYTQYSLMNLGVKIQQKLIFVADLAAPVAPFVVTLLAMVLTVAVWRARSAPTTPS